MADPIVRQSCFLAKECQETRAARDAAQAEVAMLRSGWDLALADLATVRAENAELMKLNQKLVHEVELWHGGERG